jgi:hypothetical protein
MDDYMCKNLLLSAVVKVKNRLELPGLSEDKTIMFSAP